MVVKNVKINKIKNKIRLLKLQIHNLSINQQHQNHKKFSMKINYWKTIFGNL